MRRASGAEQVDDRRAASVDLRAAGTAMTVAARTIASALAVAVLATWAALEWGARADVRTRAPHVEQRPNAQVVADASDDAGAVSGPMSDAWVESDVADDPLAHELATIVATHVCAKRMECGCRAYDSPGGTSCEADATRDFLERWPRHVPMGIPVTMPPLTELEEVLERQISCDSTILDWYTLLVADVGPGERCGYVGECRGGLACRNGVCRGGTRGDLCRDRRCQPSFRGHGRCQRVGFERLMRAGARDWTPEECVPLGAPCSYASDCGSGSCEGSGPRVCMPSGPHAIVPRRSAPTWTVCDGDDDVCEGMGYGAGQCQCPITSVCEYEVGASIAHCRPLGREGEPCRNDHCEDGLSCDRIAPEGGRCVPRICTATSFFVDLEEPYSPWSGE